MKKQLVTRSLLICFSIFLLFPTNSFALPTNELLKENSIEQEVTSNKNIVQKFISKLVHKIQDKQTKKKSRPDSGFLSLKWGIASVLLMVIAVFIGVQFYAIIPGFIILGFSAVTGVLAFVVGLRSIKKEKHVSKKDKLAGAFGFILGAVMTGIYAFYLSLYILYPLLSGLFYLLFQ